MPTANYNGEDVFTCRVNDGLADSNLATVRLTIAAVNDAPVPTDASASLAGDGFSRIDLVALASDIGSGTLTATVVAGQQP